MLLGDVHIAVTNYNKGANVNSTLHCLTLLGIDFIVFDPTDGQKILREKLRGITHVLFIGHSSDYGTIRKVRQCCSARLIIYWRGSDFWNTRANKSKWIKSMLTQTLIDDNWAVGKYFSQQIRSIGITARVIPSVIFKEKKIKEKFFNRILLYLPAVSGRMGLSAAQLHNIPLFINLARQLPEYEFITVGDGNLPEKSTNIRELGYKQDLNLLWPTVDYLFRVTVSDGLPKMIVEAAEYGVNSIVGHRFFDGLLYFTTMEELAERLRNGSFQEYQNDFIRLRKDILVFHSSERVAEAYHSGLGVNGVMATKETPDFSEINRE